MHGTVDRTRSWTHGITETKSTSRKMSTVPCKRKQSTKGREMSAVAFLSRCSYRACPIFSPSATTTTRRELPPHARMCTLPKANVISNAQFLQQSDKEMKANESKRVPPSCCLISMSPLPLQGRVFVIFLFCCEICNPEFRINICARRDLSKQTCFDLASWPAGESSSTSVKMSCTESPAE
jgi:hypothetical protein